MGFYYSARDDAEAIRAGEMLGGLAPDFGSFASIHENGVLASPHLWELTAISKGSPYRDCTAELVPVWPVGATSTVEPVEQFIQRLPDTLRDDLAGTQNTPQIAAAWSQSVWGMEPDQAANFIDEVKGLAEQARSAGRHLYWYSSL